MRDLAGRLRALEDKCAPVASIEADEFMDAVEAVAFARRAGMADEEIPPGLLRMECGCPPELRSAWEQTERQHPASDEVVRRVLADMPNAGIRCRTSASGALRLAPSPLAPIFVAELMRCIDEKFAGTDWRACGFSAEVIAVIDRSQAAY